jgi:hypothetical protein
VLVSGLLFVMFAEVLQRVFSVAQIGQKAETASDKRSVGDKIERR